MATSIVMGIACATAITIPIYKAYKLNKKIKKCWPQIKCTQVGQILHPIFGPKGISANENSQICDSGKFSSMFSSSISSTNNNISMLTDLTSNISDDVNKVRTKIQSMEKSAYSDLEDIATKIFKAYGRIAQLLVVVYGIIYKISKVFKDLLEIIRLSYYSFASAWNGPIGGTARYFANL